MTDRSPGRVFAPLLALVLVAMFWSQIVPDAQAQAALTHVTGGASGAGAEGADSSAEGLDAQSILERARAAGATIIIVDQAGRIGAPAAATPDTVDQFQSLAMEVRDRSLELLAHAPALPGELNLALERTGGFAALPPVLLLVALALVFGALAEWLVNRWAQPHMAFLFNKVPQDRAEKITFLLARGLVEVLRVVVQVLLAGGLVIALDLGKPVLQQIVLSAISFYALAAITAVFFRNLLAIGVPEHQMLALTTVQAHRLYLDVRLLVWLIAVTVWIASTGAAIELPDGAALLLLALASLVSALGCIWLTLRHRDTVAGIILGAPARLPSGLRQGIARLWHVLAVAYFVIAWAASLVDLLMGSERPTRLVMLPIVVMFGAIAFYGLLLVIADRLFKVPGLSTARRDAQAVAEAVRDGREQSPQPAVVEPPSQDMPSQEGTSQEGPASEPADPEPVDEAGPPPRDSSYGRLAERAAGWIATLAALSMIMQAWGLSAALFGAFWGAFWEIVLVIFLAWLAYEGVRIAIDRRIAEEAGGGLQGAQDEEGPRRGLSRLGTLLPLFRNFLLIAILTFAALVVLSALGVNVTPLFAGAGVIGLAIGFGAQTLIRDIFSGAFFLIDDAFRIGEYIDLGVVKGTVERVSIRSMQLRHQTGTLHTIPFGEIKRLTNFSRDWVVMKLPLRLTYDTDVEEVRKLIKKLGQELLERPDIGHLFLQPLKSQGVYQMEDSAMIIRVKYMTRPGDQFQVRKLVYSRIREIFAENGIRFAHREVTVRVADSLASPSGPEGDAGSSPGGHEGHAWELSPQTRSAIAGAALSVVAATGPGAAGGSTAPSEDR